MVIYDCCYCEQNQSLDISGAIKNGRGLKELVLFNTNEAEDSGYRFEERILVSHETINGILFWLITNQDVHTLEHAGILGINSGIVALIVPIAESHKSLKKLVVARIDDCLTGYAAKAIGEMVRSAPSQRESELPCCGMGPSAARHLANGLKGDTCVVEILNVIDIERCDEGVCHLRKAVE